MRAVANIATFEGREDMLDLMLRTAAHQFDEVNVYRNNYEAVDLADNGKFRYIENYEGQDVAYFTLDDDIMYPPDYVANTIAILTRCEAPTIVTYHGRRLRGRMLNYYKDHEAYHFMRGNTTPRLIDVPGTGVSAWLIKEFAPVGLWRSPDLCMADLLLGVEAAACDVDVLLPEFNAGWLRPIPNPRGMTIHGTFARNCDRQGELADLILDIRGR